MARAKTEKKHISFVNGTLINNLVKDRATIENRSESAIIEQIILDSFLPDNKTARDIVSSYLYCDDNAIGNTLAAFFSANAAGINWKSVHDNLLPLVQFAREQLMYSSTPLNGDEEELYHCVAQIKAIIEKLEYLAANNNEFKERLNNEIEFTKVLLSDLQDRPEQVRLVNIYQVLLNNWEFLKDSTFTYRLLMDLALLEKGWRNYAETRVELLQIINEISKEWK